MNPSEQAQPNVEALLQREQQVRQWLQDARRSHTKNLFGLWLLLVIGICVPIFPAVFRGEFSQLLPICILFAGLVVITGAYTFQEVARLHRRIDAIVKLLEDRETK
jgi:predicted ABC-type exoprotein transport system permease subunit